MISRILACVFCMLFAATVKASSGGDTDGDGDIDLDDLNNVRNNFGTTGPVGDTLSDAFPFDGVVDLDDLNAVRNNFGATSGANPVPEPASLVLLAAGAVTLTLVRQAKRLAATVFNSAHCRIDGVLASVVSVVLMAIPARASLKDDLVAHLRLEGNLNDSSGRNNNAIPANNVFFLPGTNSDGVPRNPRYGSGALDLTYAEAAEWATFPASLDDLRFGADVDFTIAFSLMNVSASSNGLDQVLIGSNDWSDSASMGWGIAQRSAAWVWRFKGATGTTHEFVGGALLAGKWHHVAVTHDRDGFARIYQDGALLGSVSIAGAGSLDVGESGRTLNIGQDGSGEHQPYVTHNLDDLGIWRRVLSPSEILEVSRNEISYVHTDPNCESIDADSDLDHDDYLIWNANVGFDTGTGVGTAESHAKGDIDYSGRVDLKDFQLILNCGSLAPAVPEPASLLLLAVGATGLAMLRRRRGAPILASPELCNQLELVSTVILRSG